MAKGMEMHMMKHKCHPWFGWLILLVGVWFLLTDLGMLPEYNIHWWTVVFLLMGLKLVCKQFVKK